MEGGREKRAGLGGGGSVGGCADLCACQVGKGGIANGGAVQRLGGTVGKGESGDGGQGESEERQSGEHVRDPHRGQVRGSDDRGSDTLAM